MAAKAAVREAVRTVTVPRQAGPVDAPLPARPDDVPAPARLVGRDRPLDPEERSFLISMVVLVSFLSTIIVGGLVFAEKVWS